jgi:hypothetical protein
VNDDDLYQAEREKAQKIKHSISSSSNTQELNPQLNTSYSFKGGERKPHVQEKESDYLKEDSEGFNHR